MRTISKVTESKQGRAWVETYRTYDTATVYEALSHDLTAKYLHHAPYVKRIIDRPNYDGTRTITVTYNNAVRTVYTVAG